MCLVKIIVYFDPRVNKPQCKMPKGRLEPAFPRGVVKESDSFLHDLCKDRSQWEPLWKEAVGPVFPWKALFQKKAGKAPLSFGLQNGVNALSVRTGVLLGKGMGSCASTLGRREMAHWVLLVPLQTVVYLCTALSLSTVASACSITLDGEEAPQGGVVRDRDTHSISLPWCFSIKSRTFINNKKGHMCRRHFSGEQKNTSHKHS